jgi:hypothetical protein
VSLWGAIVRTRLVVRTRNHRCRRCRGVGRRVCEQASRDRVADHCAAIEGWNRSRINLHDSRSSVPAHPKPCGRCCDLLWCRATTCTKDCTCPAFAVHGTGWRSKVTVDAQLCRWACPHRVCAARYQPRLLNFCRGHQIVRCMQQHDAEMKHKNDNDDARERAKLCDVRVKQVRGSRMQKQPMHSVSRVLEDTHPHQLQKTVDIGSNSCIDTTGSDRLDHARRPLMLDQGSVTDARQAKGH